MATNWGIKAKEWEFQELQKELQAYSEVNKPWLDSGANQLGRALPVSPRILKGFPSALVD